SANIQASGGSPKIKHSNGLRLSAPVVPEHLPNDTCNTDPDLAAVVAAQPELPEAVRAGIVAMVETAPRRGSNGMQTVGNG
ncbi:MAG: hypothetical protein ABSH08_22525, partial [Tepidisphaeraceae bacterium]